MFISARVRQDIQTEVELLTTCMKKPDRDDWGKLECVLKILKGTRELKLTLSVDDILVVKWWVDVSYVVHENCRLHTGPKLFLGKGVVYSFSTKQNINGKSSIEDELIGVDDSMAKIIWSRYFIEAQGYNILHTKFIQDNKSDIIL